MLAFTALLLFEHEQWRGKSNGYIYVLSLTATRSLILGARLCLVSIHNGRHGAVHLDRHGSSPNSRFPGCCTNTLHQLKPSLSPLLCLTRSIFLLGAKHYQTSWRKEEWVQCCLQRKCTERLFRNLQLAISFQGLSSL